MESIQGRPFPGKKASSGPNHEPEPAFPACLNTSKRKQSLHLYVMITVCQRKSLQQDKDSRKDCDFLLNRSKRSGESSHIFEESTLVTSG